MRKTIRYSLSLLIACMLTATAIGGKEKGKMLSASEISLTVVFDNYAHKKELETSWGFACLVKGAGKPLLFDTGGDGEILMANMRKLGIDPKSIDTVVLSHAHGDHTGGLGAFLSANSDVEIFMPVSFPGALKSGVQARGAKVVEVSSVREIREGVWTTGEMGSGIIEESLVLRTDRGLIVMTGCAHPGIVSIIEKAKSLFEGDKVLLALGGFHLRAESDKSLMQTIGRFKELGVEKAGPTHCSGDRTRELFAKEYGENYVNADAGALISF